MRDPDDIKDALLSRCHVSTQERQLLLKVINDQSMLLYDHIPKEAIYRHLLQVISDLTSMLHGSPVTINFDLRIARPKDHDPGSVCTGPD
jgi:hypothetical protein